MYGSRIRNTVTCLCKVNFTYRCKIEKKFNKIWERRHLKFFCLPKGLDPDPGWDFSIIFLVFCLAVEVAFLFRVRWFYRCTDPCLRLIRGSFSGSRPEDAGQCAIILYLWFRRSIADTEHVWYWCPFRAYLEHVEGDFCAGMLYSSSQQL